MRLAGYLHLTAIGAFVVAVIALLLGEMLVATVMFILATAGFGATVIIQRRRR